MRDIATRADRSRHQQPSFTTCQITHNPVVVAGKLHHQLRDSTWSGVLTAEAVDAVDAVKHFFQELQAFC